MDPSPFHEKDLDHDAEEFIVSWAREYPLEAPLRLIVHLHSPNGCGDSVEIVERAVHNYFRHRAELSRRELRQLFRAGRISLVIGLSFLAICLSGAEMLKGARIPGATVLGRKPEDRGLGSDVAPNGSLPVRLVASSSNWQNLSEAKLYPGGSSLSRGWRG